MKFKELKNKEFTACFDLFILPREFYTEYYNVEVQNKLVDGKYILKATHEGECDNGLYVETYTYPLKITWKDLRYNLTHYDLRHQEKYRKPFQITIFKGKCVHCGKLIKFEEGFCDRGTLIDKFNGFICGDCETLLWNAIYSEDDCVDKCLQRTVNV